MEAPKLTCCHARRGTGEYILTIDAPDDDLTCTSLDADEAGRAVLTWPADPPAKVDGDGQPVPALTRKEYEQMQRREAALLVRDAIARTAPEGGGRVDVVAGGASVDLTDVT